MAPYPLNREIDPTLPESEEARLSRLVKDLSDAVAARDRLLTVAAHELRNPINTVAMQIAVVQAMAVKRGDLALADRLQKAVGALDWLLKRAMVLLDVTRAAAGTHTLQLATVDLREVIQQVEGLYQVIAETRQTKLHFECTGLLVGHWDSLALEQMLSNLVSNAIKFGNGTVVLLSADEPDTGRVQLRVSDLGHGISPEEQERIFWTFDRVMASADKRNGGFGLGLWLTRVLAEAHGGTLRISSSPGAGATFYIDLPKQPPAPREDSGQAIGLTERRKQDRRASSPRPGRQTSDKRVTFGS